MANIFELVGQIAVKGADRAQTAISGVDDKGRSLADTMDAAGTRVSAFGDRVSGVGDRMSTFSAIATTAAGAVGAFIGKMTSMADETLSAANRIGVSTDALQTWQQTGSRFGIQQEALRDGFKELQIRADEFSQTAKGPAAEAFKRLGLSQQQVTAQKDDTIGLFNDVLDRIKDVESAAGRQRILDELFGGQAAEQFPELMTASREEIEQIQQQVREGGEIISREDLERAREFQNQWRAFRSTLKAVAQTVAIDMLPAFQSLLEQLRGPLTGALQALGSIVGGVASAFTALPEPLQQIAISAGLIAAGMGPVLSIFGRAIGVFGKLLSGVKLLIPVFTALSTAALGPLLPIISAVVIAVGILWAAWEYGPQIIRAVGQAYEWLRGVISRVIEFIYKNTIGRLQALWQGVKSILNSIVQGFKDAWQAVKDATIGRVMDMVDTVTSAVKKMWETLTGNSIIPRLADEATAEFDRMAKGAEEAGERTRRGMTDAIKGVESPDGGSGGGGNRQRDGGQGTTIIDMSHSTFRDDRDMLDRLRRKGSDMTGAFT